jgi:SAM-dependent methyltransferase
LDKSHKSNPTTRFSNRVQYYIKYRPQYPKEILDFLKKELKLSIRHAIADIGSGTGFLSGLFLQNGSVVYGVEPNQEMREAAEKLLKQYPSFKSIEGSAEFTNLQPQSIDFITAGQAFHWFDIEKSKKEFNRILKPNGWVILIWNERTDRTPFLKAYEILLKTFAIDYQKVDHRKVDDGVLTQFFGSTNYKLKKFKNKQQFDYKGLKGRLLSSSYAPMEGHSNHRAMVDELGKIFKTFQENGQVTFEYDTKVYYGKLY